MCHFSHSPHRSWRRRGTSQPRRRRPQCIIVITYRIHSLRSPWRREGTTGPQRQKLHHITIIIYRDDFFSKSPDRPRWCRETSRQRQLLQHTAITTYQDYKIHSPNQPWRRRGTFRQRRRRAQCIIIEDEKKILRFWHIHRNYQDYKIHSPGRPWRRRGTSRPRRRRSTVCEWRVRPPQARYRGQWRPSALTGNWAARLSSSSSPWRSAPRSPLQHHGQGSVAIINRPHESMALLYKYTNQKTVTRLWVIGHSCVVNTFSSYGLHVASIVENREGADASCIRK